MITKHGEVHFTKDLGTLGKSDRVILPQTDGCRVKVTRFHGTRTGFARNISYTTDETVYVVSGVVEVAEEGYAADQPKRLEAGDCYHVRAGEEYSINILEECVLLCIFSTAIGPLPDNE